MHWKEVNIVGGVLVNVCQPLLQEKRHCFVVFADFHGVHLTMADTKLPILNWLTELLKI